MSKSKKIATLAAADISVKCLLDRDDIYDDYDDYNVRKNNRNRELSNNQIRMKKIKNKRKYGGK